MKKIFLGLVVALALVGMAEPSEYRNFKNQEGKDIYARVVQYDAKGERVQLELKNHKKAWVELSALSESDQTYVRNMNTSPEKSDGQKNEPKPTNKPFSKKQVKEIAEKYIEAVMNKDYEAWAGLMADTKDFDEQRFNARYALHPNPRFYWGKSLFHLKKIHYRSSENNSAKLTLKREHSSYEPECWLILQPDGKIKYDSLFIPHPVLVVRTCLGYFWSPDRKRNTQDERVYSDTLIETGVPLFDYTPESSRLQQAQSVRKIFDWLEKNGDEWDISEPKVFYPGEIIEFIDYD